MLYDSVHSIRCGIKTIESILYLVAGMVKYLALRFFSAGKQILSRMQYQLRYRLQQFHQMQEESKQLVRNIIMSNNKEYKGLSRRLIQNPVKYIRWNVFKSLTIFGKKSILDL